jgi:Domain of unknown function (DUF4180)
MTAFVLHGTQVYACAPDGKKLRTGRDATDLMGEAFEYQAGMLVIPAERLDEDFFRLRTGVAGEIVQKFVQYGARIAVVGDISHYVSESTAFRDFARETNRGSHFCFVADIEELGTRLERARAKTKL